MNSRDHQGLLETRNDREKENSSKYVSTRERIIVALDFPSVEEARRCFQALKGKAVYLKVGMELYYAAGPSFVQELKEEGFKVFVDLKLHDIPNTVKGAARSLTRLGADMFNVHASGGLRMMEAAREGVEEGLAPGQPRPFLIAVTVLTSTGQRELNDEIGVQGTLDDHVLHLAHLTRRAGLDGVVASPLEVPLIKSEIGADFITVTPGIRPAGDNADDQTRIATPEKALELGTDFMVIGRTITRSERPGERFEEIVQTLEKGAGAS